MAKKSTETSVDRLVPIKTLIGLVKETGLRRKRIQSMVGEIGERVAEASEKHNLHRGVFTLMCKLAAMDELKREDFIRQFPIYVEMCRKGDVFGAESYGDLLESNETQADEEEQESAAEAAQKAVEAPRQDAELLNAIGRGKKRQTRAKEPEQVH